MSEVMQTHYSTCWKDPKHHACAVGEITLCHQQLAEKDRQLKQLAVKILQIEKHYKLIGGSMAEYSGVMAIIKPVIGLAKQLTGEGK